MWINYSFKETNSAILLQEIGNLSLLIFISVQ